MGYFIAANCQYLGGGNFCLHPARELSKWNPLRYIAIGGKRPLCVFTQVQIPPYEDEISCALQVKRPRPEPPRAANTAGTTPDGDGLMTAAPQAARPAADVTAHATARPWSEHGKGGCSCGQIFGPDGNAVICMVFGPGNVGDDGPDCYPNERAQQANAALIVRAVNAHDDLVAALRDILRIAKAASIGVTGNAPRIARAEAALAKATQP